VGEHTPGKESFGHSMVVSPWGEVLADTGAKVGIAYAEINPEVIASTRAKLPVLKNKRLELY
jgi:predicted amidohydrolase